MEERFCKVLIVDDEFIIRQGISYMMNWENEGFKIVAEASNGEDALTKIEEFHPDIVVSDIVMPKMDGMELTKIIREKYPDIRVIILSSYSEFDYVRNTFQYGAVDYILKPTLSPESILQALKNAASQINGMVLHNAQFDQINGPLTQYILGYVDELPKEDIQSFFHDNNYILVATNIAFHPDKKEIRNFFQVQLEQIPNTHACSMLVNEEVLLCIYSYAQEEVASLHQNIRKELSGKELCFLSEPFYCIEDIRELYHKQIVPALKNRFYLKNQNLVSLNMQIAKDGELERFDNRTFAGLLSSLHLSEAMDIFYAYVMNALQARSDEFEIKTFACNKLYNFISVLEERDFNEKSIRYFKLDCLSKLESAPYMEDFQKELKQIYDDFQIIITNYELESNQATINRMMKYVYDHYDEALTLNDLAQKFNFSYQYLSSYFSNRTEKTFIEYLNEIRIDHAAAFLKEQDLPISDIGIKVGYSDHSYFCKVFKKYKGMTPSEYRKH
ncbi:response regulator transcription factor [Amedibacillus sp. YH-ame10]